MFNALLADARRVPGLDIVAVVDERLSLDIPAGIDRRLVKPGDELDVLTAAAATADATLVVAPETAAILARRVAAVQAAGGVPLACAARFISIAADKQATALALAAAGVPVPAGRSLEPGAAWPREFVRPAIRKRRDGVGGDGLLLVGRGVPPPPAAHDATRIEAFVPGLPVGVSLICGNGDARPVAVLEQIFDAATPGSYRGGRSVAAPDARHRAAGLACRAVAALERAAGAAARGWVGVDMILGGREDGLADRVLEVNPRLTTAFVGLAARSSSSLVAAMLDPASLPCPAGLVPAAIDFRIGADA